MGKKRILVANNHLISVGGSELYTYDLIKALRTIEGVEVEYFTFFKGEMSDRIEDELYVSFMSRKRYDLILASHNSTVKELFNKGPIIQICHGVLADLEFPSPLADFYIAITEEVASALNDQDLPHEVILNGVDVREKKPIKPINPQLQTVLSLCQNQEANTVLEKCCDELGLHFRYFNKHENPVFDIAKEINKSDIVVGIGRSVYDAMACGRPCVIYDNRPYNGNKADGYLRPTRFFDYVKNNCSGRFLSRTYSRQELMREMIKYNPSDGMALREIAEKELNVYKMADRLLQMPKHLSWRNRIKKWQRFSNNFKLFKRAYFYKKIYGLTNNEYFNR